MGSTGDLTDDQKVRFTALFDAALDSGDTSALETLVDAGGVHPIMLLAQMLDYPRQDEILRKAISHSVKKHAEDVRNTKMEYAYGCRKEGSDADESFVVVKANGAITVAHFVDGKDFIGHPAYDDEAKETLDRFIAGGWTPMTEDDIVKTSGIHRDNVLHWGPPLRSHA